MTHTQTHTDAYTSNHARAHSHTVTLTGTHCVKLFKQARRPKKRAEPKLSKTNSKKTGTAKKAAIADVDRRLREYKRKEAARLEMLSKIQCLEVSKKKRDLADDRYQYTMQPTLTLHCTT